MEEFDTTYKPMNAVVFNKKTILLIVEGRYAD